MNCYKRASFAQSFEAMSLPFPSIFLKERSEPNLFYSLALLYHLLLIIGGIRHLESQDLLFTSTVPVTSFISNASRLPVFILLDIDINNGSKHGS
jgi:hypothetical protein